MSDVNEILQRGEAERLARCPEENLLDALEELRDTSQLLTETAVMNVWVKWIERAEELGATPYQLKEAATPLRAFLGLYL